MSDQTDQEMLQNLREMPGFSLNKEQKQRILENLMQEEKRYMRQVRARSSFSRVGKGIALCALLGAVWAGAVMKQGDQQVAQSPMQHNAASNVQAKGQALLNQQFELARQGRVEKGGITVEHSLIDTIEKQWGKPDATRFENGLTYDTYTKRGLDIGFNKGMQVVEIRYKTPALAKITLAQMKKGPDSMRTTIADQIVFVFKPNEKYEFRVIFSAPTTQAPDPAIQYIEVRYPQGAVNMMAQPAPDELLKQLKEHAAKGQLLDVPVTAGKSLIDQVEKEWGKPARQDFASGLRYSVYPDKNVVLASNKGDQIVEIRSYDYQLGQIKQSQVKKTLGKPTEQVDTGQQLIAVYQVGPDYQLKVVFPAPTKKIPDPTIDHVNVLYPRGMVTMMTQ